MKKEDIKMCINFKNLITYLLVGVGLIFLLGALQNIHAADTFDAHHKLGLTPDGSTVWVAYDDETKAMAETLDPASAGPTTKRAYKIKEVRLLTSATVTTDHDFSITIDSGVTVGLDHYLYEKSMSGVSSITWRPDNDVWIRGQDILTFAWDNTGIDGWTLEVTYEIPRQ